MTMCCRKILTNVRKQKRTYTFKHNALADTAVYTGRCFSCVALSRDIQLHILLWGLDMDAPVKLFASLDPNPINITVRRLNADLHDVNGVDMEEADGVTLSSGVLCSGHQSCYSMLYACILHRANTGRRLRMSLIYGHISVTTEYIPNLLPIFSYYSRFLYSSVVP